MRISDWSSDVCSSDLAGEHQQHHDERVAERAQQLQRPVRRLLARDLVQAVALQARADLFGVESAGVALQRVQQRVGADRKSVVEGKSVSVRVALGGRRIINKKNNKPLAEKKTK